MIGEPIRVASSTFAGEGYLTPTGDDCQHAVNLNSAGLVSRWLPHYYETIYRLMLAGFCLLLCSTAVGQSISVSGGRSSFIVSGRSVSDKPTEKAPEKAQDRIVPAPIQKPEVVVHAKPQPYLAMFTATYCQPCKSWKRTEKHRIESSGFKVVEYEMTTERYRRKFSDSSRGDRCVSSMPTFAVIDSETGEWLSDAIVGAVSANSLIPLLRQRGGMETVRPIYKTPIVQETPGRYTTYNGRTYDWENETYSKCSMRNCGMCDYLYNACWSYRNSRRLINAIGPQSPTPDDAIDEALDLLDLKPDSVFAELGCGDGRVLVRALQRCERRYGSPCRAIGIEIDPAKVAEAKRMILAHGLSGSVTILQGDVREFSPERHSVTHIYAYLYPELLQEISETLKSVDVTVCPGHECPGIGMKLVGQCWVRKSA